MSYWESKKILGFCNKNVQCLRHVGQKFKGCSYFDKMKVAEMFNSFITLVANNILC